MLRRVAAPALAGLLVAASLPPWGWWPLGLIGIASYASIVTVDRARAGFLPGFSFAFAWFVPGMAWMWFLTAPGYVVAAVLFSAMHGLAGGIARRVARDARSHRTALVVCHSLAEALRMSWPFGGVPLATIAIGQSGGPFLRLAPWFGAIGLGAVVWWVSAGARRTRAVAVVLVLMVAVSVWDGTTESGRTIRLAVVQGGGEQGTHAIDTDPREVLDAHLAATRTLDPDAGRTAVVWPENVVDMPGDEPFAGSAAHRLIAAEARRLAVPFAVGITESGGPGRFLNATVVVEPDGRISSRYDKKRRVPFGEYVPARDVLTAMGAPTNMVPLDAVPGDEPGLIELAGTRAAVAISWEIFFGGRVNEGVVHGGGYVLNPTNGSSYTGTILQTQQIASSRLRAREQRRWVVQAAPTGFSAFIDPDGTVHQRTSISERAVIEHAIEVRDGRTPYSRLGNGVYIAILFVALALLARRRSRAFPQASS